MYLRSVRSPEERPKRRLAPVTDDLFSQPVRAEELVEDYEEEAREKEEGWDGKVEEGEGKTWKPQKQERIFLRTSFIIPFRCLGWPWLGCLKK